MTIEEMQQARRDAEEQIRAILGNFMRASGAKVSSVEFTLIEMSHVAGPPMYVPGEVHLDVRL